LEKGASVSVFDEMAKKLRKTGIWIFSLLILLCAGGTAWGEGKEGELSRSDLMILCMIEPGNRLAGEEITFRPGDALSAQELQAITGKGMAGLRGASQDPEAAARIILWDEAHFLGASGLEFSNQGDTRANAQTNTLVTGGR
jgi:hypothetical protein